MTFTEELREHEAWLRIEAAEWVHENYLEVAEVYRAKADKIRALADYADGRTLVMPSVFLSGNLVISIIEARNRAGVSVDAGVSKSQLQGFVDSDDGRVMPE